jgi:hypothetical protein
MYQLAKYRIGPTMNARAISRRCSLSSGNFSSTKSRTRFGRRAAISLAYACGASDSLGGLIKATLACAPAVASSAFVGAGYSMRGW